MIALILAQLDAELEGYARSARAAHEEATHEQSKAENKYDTRGLEASYLAHGQSKLAAEVTLARQDFAGLKLWDYRPEDEIEVGNLVEIEDRGESLYYFLGPRAGGMEVNWKGKEIFVITPQSPLGQHLMGAKLGQKLKLTTGGKAREVKVVSVV